MAETMRADAGREQPVGSSASKLKAEVEEASPVVGKTYTMSTRCPDEEQSPSRETASSACGRDEYSLYSPSDVGGDSPEGLARSSTVSPPTSSAGDSPPGTSSPPAGPARRSNKLKTALPPAIAEEQAESEDLKDFARDGAAEAAVLRGAPPGLAEPTVPSRGSGLHGMGSCSPCVWNWKPQGCHRGRECGYCHLCPEGEIKSRKKSKLANIRAGSSGSLQSAQSGNLQDELCEAPTASEEAAGATPAPAEEKAVAAAIRTPVATPGSALHGTGECRPCAWFYKPQGCQNGAECRHCHLCPEGEIKSRKKSKIGTIRTITSKDKLQTPLSAAAPPKSAAAEPKKVEEAELAAVMPGMIPEVVGANVAPPPGLAHPTSPPQPLPSVGSVLHGSGECRPCAWFHKPQGCQNGAECRHCHLCAEGEIKSRRKAKAASHRSGSLCAEDTLEDPEQQPEARPRQEKEEPAEPEARLEAAKVCLPLPSRRTRAEPLPSPGSALHGTGECRPCAWFHKLQGCENGAECRHCHLCPEGEIRERRKTKVSVLKKQASKGQELDMEQALWAVQKQQEALLAAQWQAQAQWEAVVESSRRAQEAEQATFSMSPMSVDISMAVSAMATAAAMATASVAAAMDASPVAGLSRGLSPAASPSPVGAPIKVSAEAFPTTPTAAELPSTGSALHVLGKCRPCAWFWKPQGCQNGKACAHCHLCPEGELKERKRVKEAAMRMGALVPVRQQQQQGGSTPHGQPLAMGRSPRVVKIAPILGA